MTRFYLFLFVLFLQQVVGIPRLSPDLLPAVLHVRSDSVHLTHCNHTDLVVRAVDAWNFKGISDRFIVVESDATNNPPGLDNINEFVFGPYTKSGAAYPRKREIDAVVNVDIFPDCATLYWTVLHEMGHMYGLDHPWFDTDSIMGSKLTLYVNQTVVSMPWPTRPTKLDIQRLFQIEYFYYFKKGVKYRELAQEAVVNAMDSYDDMRVC